jgi:histidine ammonia-lyase
MRQKTEFMIHPGKLTLNHLRGIYEGKFNKLSITKESKIFVEKSVKSINDLVSNKNMKAVYGVNTGFGKLANTRINEKDLSTLQHNLIMSHCTGVGDFLDDNMVMLIATLKVASLGRGYSGIRFELLEALLQLINNGYYPCIPIKGSVGASGDLAPLAHLAAPLIGVGYVRNNGKRMSAIEALKECNIEKFELLPLEGLSLLNGTQVSTALAIKGLFKIQDVFDAGLIAGALSTEALNGSIEPYDPRIHELRGHKGQLVVAEKIKGLLGENGMKEQIIKSGKVQDPYSLRCQPQVMGACLDQINYVANTLEIEANAVTNNPISLSETNEFISGGNFHAEPVAFSADILAMICTEISSLSERRISLMVDANFSGLPAFLVNNSGLNSGFMIAQVTAAALVSENKSRSFPCSVDSIPTSANQEDHVSMATHAAFRLSEMADNSAYVIAIELLSAVQALDLKQSKNISSKLKRVSLEIRKLVPYYEKDRYFSDDIELIKKYLLENPFNMYH